MLLKGSRQTGGSCLLVEAMSPALEVVGATGVEIGTATEAVIGAVFWFSIFSN
jgi:hypothetical protein